MSNCISIRDSRVVFGGKEIDAAGLMAALGQHGKCKGFDVHGGFRKAEAEEWACQMAQWFLVPGRNVGMTGDSLVVHFGSGRSSHTWRDFQSAVLFLDQFMLGTKSHMFQLRDDDMGGGSMSRSTVVFMPGEKKHVFLHDMRQELRKVEAELAKLGVSC